MITRRLPELFLTSGLNGQSVEIRCYPTSSQVSRECSCILPPWPKCRLFKGCWLQACVTAGRPVAVATEYVGYSRCYGDKENHCLCSFGYHHGNNIGFCIRKFLLSFPFILLNRHEQKLLLVSVLCIQIIALYLYSERVIWQHSNAKCWNSYSC